MPVNKFHVALLVSLMLCVNCMAQNTTVNVDSLKKNDIRAYRNYYWVNLPKQQGNVNDFDHVFTPAQQQTLDSLIKQHIKNSNISFTIVTIDTFATAKQVFEDIAIRFARVWGIGVNTQTRGFAICICSGHKRFRITTGYAFESVVNDSETREISDHTMIPHLKQNDYFSAVVDGINALVALAKGKGQ